MSTNADLSFINIARRLHCGESLQYGRTTPPRKVRVKFRRIALIVTVVVTGIFLAEPWSHATTLAPSSQPIFQFKSTNSGPLPWNAASLEPSINHTTMLGGPHAASSATEGALAYRTSNNHLALYTQNASGASRWTDLSYHNNNLPAPGADPIPFFDPSGGIDLLYVNTLGELILTTANDPVTPLWHHLTPTLWRPYISIDLSALIGVSAANGLPSIQVNGNSGFIAFRTASNSVEELPLSWSPGNQVPTLTGPATTVAPAGTVSADPVTLPGSIPAFVTTSDNGDLVLYATSSVAPDPWTTRDLTMLTAGPTVSGPLAIASTSSALYVAALGTTGSVELFSTGANTSSPTTTTVAQSTWSVLNVTSAASSDSPPSLDGSIFIDATPTQISIAGQAANWGDLFAFTSPRLTGPWLATDVSATGGNAARTVGPVVAGLRSGTTFSLYAAGIASPPLQGVGVYAIPYNDTNRAITNGWPIISETGGLGTQAAPWVGYTSSQATVATSPDFAMAQSIYNSHQRVTWLSFWTVSGPLAGEYRTAATYYGHGFAAGAWVATQIDQYRSLGVGTKPDWVIFDPEGLPDNHSGLDGTPTKTYAKYWTNMVQGWIKGLASVDPTLNAGLYANMSEYRNYGLATQPLPVFMAVAFGGGGPVRITGASGTNIRGYIAFDAVCKPTATLKSEESTLTSPPWSGQFNTLQFNAGVYCPPA